jgi:hypothetical protein
MAHVSRLVLLSFPFLMAACATVTNDTVEGGGTGSAATGGGGGEVGSGGVIGAGNSSSTGGGTATGGTGTGGAGTGGGSATGGAGTGGAATGGSSGACAAAWTAMIYPTTGTKVNQEGIDYISCYYANADQEPKSNNGATCSVGKPWAVVGPCP